MNAVGFGPLLRLLSKGVASSIQVQALVERWCDTTNTFHIGERVITVTSNDFHQMTGLRSHGPIINLEDQSSIQLGIDLLGCTYPSEHVHYFDLERDYKSLFHTILDDHARMVRAFLLYVLGEYLFVNGG